MRQNSKYSAFRPAKAHTLQILGYLLKDCLREYSRHRARLRTSDARGRVLTALMCCQDNSTAIPVMPHHLPRAVGLAPTLDRYSLIDQVFGLLRFGALGDQITVSGATRCRDVRREAHLHGFE